MFVLQNSGPGTAGRGDRIVLKIKGKLPVLISTLREQCEQEPLLGVGLTGGDIADMPGL